MLIIAVERRRAQAIVEPENFSSAGSAPRVASGQPGERRTGLDDAEGRD